MHRPTSHRPASLALVLSLLALLLASAPGIAGDYVHPYDFPQHKKAPDTIFAGIEIPAGSFTKYELDSETGHVMVDRFVRMPVAYPANYGFVTQSLGGDGDPLDVMVVTRAPLHPGVLIKVRPIAVLKTLDGGEVDDKIIAVPVTKLDPTYEQVKDIGDLPDQDRQRIEAFFRVYKQMKSSKVVEVKGWADVGEAKRMIQAALEAYKSNQDN